MREMATHTNGGTGGTAEQVVMSEHAGHAAGSQRPVWGSRVREGERGKGWSQGVRQAWSAMQKHLENPTEEL